MKANTKAKWIVGITGAAFSAFVLGQLDDEPAQKHRHKEENIGMLTEITDSMSEREKELVKLDWSNFELERTYYQGADNFDRATRRS